MTDIDFAHFERAFSHRFKDESLLERALTHRSLQRGSTNDYERFEFLGDAVLDLAVAHLLLEAHPACQEGVLSKMRAALVSMGSLAEIAREVELGRFVRLSRGEISTGGGDRPSILADVLEAVIGAIYREAGFDAALGAVRGIFGDRIKSVSPHDPKTDLQEKLQELGKSTPVYLLECTEGPEHRPTFVSVVMINGEVAGRGRGSTKKMSQQEAAAVALADLEKKNG